MSLKFNPTANWVTGWKTWSWVGMLRDAFDKRLAWHDLEIFEKQIEVWSGTIIEI